MNDVGAELGHQAARIRQFLLKGPAQQRGQNNRGAVAGTVQATGQAHYVYGEITGYYLHWLSSLPDEANAEGEVTQATAAALDWLAAYLSGAELPLTRIYLRDALDDWRNEALFLFDLAMIAGGVARAGQRGLAVVPASLLDDLQRWLQQFVSADALKVCLKRSDATPLPQRWSTTGGAFTAKTASRILLLGSHRALPESLLAASRRQLQQTARLAERNGIDMVHPTLYALEGCLLSPDADLERLALWFEQIVALQGADGSLPESLQTADIRRSDIIAQALRVGIFLETLLQQPGRYRDASRRFAEALVARVRADGTVPFCPDGKAEANVWSAMFAEQALRLYRANILEQPLPFAPEALV